MYNQINYKSNYKKIVEIQIKHDFFKSNNCSVFEIRPDIETQNLIKNYGIIFKKISNGFVLISSGELRYSSGSFNGPITLRFSLKNNDPLFLNYTKLNLEDGNHLIFKNRGDEELLHESEFVDQSSIAGISEELFSGEIVITINNENEFFGLGSEESTAAHKPYQIKFTSREVTVRYNFYSSNEAFDFADYYVTDEENTLKINTIEERQLASGKNVFCIQRAEPVKCSQFNDESFFLKKEDNFLNTFSIQLPSLDPKNISNVLAQQKYFAEIYVGMD